MDIYNKKSPEVQKEMYTDKLDFFHDTFPITEEEASKQSKKGFWTKYEADRRYYYLFSKNPDYIDKELFYKIMNGIGPDLIKTKVKKLK